MLSSAGWLDVALLPDGGMPVTDGATVATILDPEGDPDIALAAPGEDVRLITVPMDHWADPWRGIHGFVPLVGRTGYLLVGAAAIAVLDDEGTIDVRPVPDGYVALAPTSDPERFLLATIKDAGEPYALSEGTRFAAYVWTVGSDQPPTILSPVVVAVAPSTIGLAWLRTADGSWWSVAPTRTCDRPPSQIRSTASSARTIGTSCVPRTG